MKAKKHTKALLLALSVVSMLMASLFVVNTQAGANVPECPEGFEATEDGKACWAIPSRVTVQDPAYCEEGEITPDGKHCITEVSYNTQDPLSKHDIIDAKVTTGDTTYRCPSGWTGPTAKADGSMVCTQSVAQPNLTQPASEATGSTSYTCNKGGSLKGDMCTIPGTTDTQPGTYVPAVPDTPGTPGSPAKCPAGYDPFPTSGGAIEKCYADTIGYTSCPSGGSADPSTLHSDGTFKGCLAPIIPAVPAIPGEPGRPATCNGAPTTAGPGACVTTTTTDPVTYPATPVTGPSSYYCPDGWMGPDSNNMCSKAQPGSTNEIAATPVAGGSDASCPEGYTGPTSDLKCEREVLTAQPNVPTCTSGTLLKVAKNNYVCLLDDAPISPDPVVRAECKRGTYDSKQDKCFVASTMGGHVPSVTVVDKEGAVTTTPDEKKPAPVVANKVTPAKIGFTG